MPPDQQQPQQGNEAGLVFDKFAGVNTATTRPGVPDEMAYWLDGFMPLAPGNLRTLYGIGAAKYTATGGKTIVCFYFYNLGATPYAVLFLSDGSVVQVNTSTGAATQILPTNSIAGPSITSLGITQYGSQYLIIVSNQPNGYWVWDGTILYQAGTLGPGVTLTDPGSGYQTVPSVTASGGNGHGAMFVATIGGGVVTNVTEVNPGSGYLPGDVVTLAFSGGTLAGSGAALTAVLTHAAGGSGGALTPVWNLYSSGGGTSVYELTNVTIGTPGSGYSANVAAGFNAAPAGSGWGYYAGGSVAPSMSVTETGGAITGVVAYAPPGNPTYYYATPTASPAFPTISVSDTGYYYVSSVTISNGGSNYSPGTIITASSGGTPITQATILPVISGGIITGTNITGPGIYDSNTAPTLTVTDTARNAAGTITLMPFGIQGTAVETYQGYVWVVNGTLINFSAPGSVSNFATSAGGGSDQTNNSYTKVGYTQLVSTNGFLFLIGDNSMDYISGVVTNTPQGGNPRTTYTQNNSDPEVGTPYPAAVTTLGQEILLANSAGIFVSSGGAYVKKSEAMDGVYNTVPNFGGLQLSAAKATIFGKRVWMVLAQIVDPVANATQNKILMFNGQRWWASLQDVALTFIGGQEINSVYTAWGTDGTSLYPLFNTPSTAFTKLAQTKLWDDPGGIESSKADSRFWSVWQYYIAGSVAGSVPLEEGWNPAFAPATITYSNSNYTATLTSGEGGTSATINQGYPGYNSGNGKFYVEIQTDALFVGTSLIGVSTDGVVLGDGSVWIDGTGELVNFQFGDTGINLGSPASSIIRIAFDTNTNLVWIALNGGPWNGNAINDPVAEIGGQNIGYLSTGQAQPFFVSNLQLNSAITINTGDGNQGAFVYSNPYPAGSTNFTDFTLFIDGVGIDPNGNQYTNSQSYDVTGPMNPGFFVSLPLAVGQQGVLTGMTLATNTADAALISAKIAAENVGYRG